MWTLHMIDGGRRGLEDAILSVGLIDPSSTDPLRVYDFGLRRFVVVAKRDVVAIATGDPAAVSFAPSLRSRARAAANKKVIPLRRKRPEVSEDFQTGYTTYAQPAALFWREHGVGSQPLLAAGVFSLSSIQTPIASALRLFSALMPHVIDNHLPRLERLVAIVKASGAGLDSPETGRPRWYREYERYREHIVVRMAEGERDDPLRRELATQVPLPLGLGLSKLSFTLALVGNNLGCLDARIIGWAFSREMAERFNKRISRKRPDGSFGDEVYDAYRSAELRILTNTPFYDPEDPVALARAQWMLWESLGPVAEGHSHEEIFEAVQEPAVLARL